MAGESDNSTLDLNVYPNPTDDHVIVEFTGSNEEVYKIRLIDVTGRVILSENYKSVIGESQYQMNLSELARGVYVVILQNSNAVFQSKIVVQ
jgi:hypothetical protein